ncbi:hypothetical protein [Halogranum rubrum]|nr:hypothetical protein [Halogranum rubrum]
MSNRLYISVHRQTAFSDDGQLEVTEMNVETSLEYFGAEANNRNRESRRDQPAASESGIDDRPEVARVSEGDQLTLFVGTDENQQTLVVTEATDY